MDSGREYGGTEWLADEYEDTLRFMRDEDMGRCIEVRLEIDLDVLRGGSEGCLFVTAPSGGDMVGGEAVIVAMSQSVFITFTHTHTPRP